MGLNPKQFDEYVVYPTLQLLDPEIPYSLAGHWLTAATIYYESDRLVYLDQTTPGPGPAYGLPQIEKSTFENHQRWLMRSDQEVLRRKVSMLAADYPDWLSQLRTNLMFAVAFCRIHFWRVAEPLPEEGDYEALAGYYKKFYNTYDGKATVEAFLDKIKILRI